MKLVKFDITAHLTKQLNLFALEIFIQVSTNNHTPFARSQIIQWSYFFLARAFGGQN